MLARLNPCSRSQVVHTSRWAEYFVADFDIVELNLFTYPRSLGFQA